MQAISRRFIQKNTLYKKVSLTIIISSLLYENLRKKRKTKKKKKKKKLLCDDRGGVEVEVKVVYR